MIKSRLLTLADHLDRVSERHMHGQRIARKFDMNTWYRRTECGTAACAIGEATHIPRFRKLGLRLKPRLTCDRLYPALRKLRGWAAVQSFFGISFEVARYLFWGDSYPGYPSVGPALVAARIREYVAKGDV